MIILVRHAHAGDKQLWTAPDVERPLSERGRQQAQGLTHILSMLDRPRLLSSPYLRCRQTLAPLAQRSRSPVEQISLLAPNARASRLDRLLSDLLDDPTQEGTVLCTHGETISGLLRRWHSRRRLTVTDRATSDRATSGQAAFGQAAFGQAAFGQAVSGQAVSGRDRLGPDGLGKNVTEKGAAWVVVADGRHRVAHYLRPVHVGPVLGPDSDRPITHPRNRRGRKSGATAVAQPT